jgi:hypothetical protein|tara:strand:+ start:194 stop:403 length:210 start_codon:yes stop_codon:yes gene_type:complete
MIITFPTSPVVGEVLYVSDKSWTWTGKAWDASVGGDFSGLRQEIQVEEAARLIQTQNIIAKRQLKGQTA